MALKLRSIGHRSDLFFAGTLGQIEETPTCLVVRHPSNPAYVWGNYLLFPEAPTEENCSLTGPLSWCRLFQEHFPSPEVGHWAFGWDRTDGVHGAAERFVSRGFRCENLVVLQGSKPNSADTTKENAAALLLHPGHEALWASAFELLAETQLTDPRSPNERQVLARLLAGQRELVRRGLGAWWALLHEGRLAATLGVFCIGEACRFQAVATHPDYRRRGFARTLLRRAMVDACQRWSVASFVIVTESESQSLGLYQGQGFEVREKLCFLSGPRLAGPK